MTYSATLYLTTYFFKVKYSNRAIERLNAIIMLTVIDRTKITIADTYEVAYWFSIGIFVFNLGTF